MIKVRISSLKSGKLDRDFEINQFETIEDAFKRALDHIPEDAKKKKTEIFHVIVNGKKIDPDFLQFYKLTSSDEVLIAPIIRGGDGNATFRQLAMLGVAAVVGFYFPPAAFAPYGFVGLAGALASAGAVMLSALAVNALIPPSSQSINVDQPQSQSQMYFISSQSNSVNKFGFVPRVYGTHKVFPNVAANPYTELEIDEATGQLAQFLYCVYDFGFGPNIVEDIRIGGTPIAEFSDYKFRLVDFNRPLTPEGTWDEATGTDLLWYKGDVASEEVAVVLNSDQLVVGGGDPTLYQATRTVPENLRDEKQEISLAFTFPQGLYARNAEAVLGDRLVDVFIEFRKAGSSDPWRGFNDYNYVDTWSVVGGQQALFNLGLELYPFKIGDSILLPGWEDYEDPDPTPYVNLYTGERRRHSRSQWESDVQYGGVVVGRYREVGIVAGATNVVVKANPELFVGGPLRYNNQLLGYIDSIVPYVPNPAYVTLNIDRALPEITLFEYILRHNWDGIFSVHYPIDLKTTGKFESASNANGLARFARRSINPTAAVLKFTPKVIDDYEVRVTRYNSQSTPATYTSLKVDAMTWTSLSARFDTKPIVTDKRHTFLELKIRATGQLNGAIQNLSAVCTSVLDIYDPNTETWSKGPTNNPAWVFCDLLTGQVNRRAISKDRLHMDSIVEWKEFCDEIPTSPDPLIPYNFPRFQTNFVLDYQTTLQGIVAQVTSAGQASLNIMDSQYGILIDKLRTTPVQIFTPRNSSRFTSSRNYTTKPDAVKVQYVDPTLGWEVAEEIVYEDGFDVMNAEKFDELVCFGATNDEQAWRYGRYMIFQNRLRQENMSIVVDFEHLVCTRGDFVQITQDVMRVGGIPARVKTVAGNIISIDNAVDIDPSEDYGYVFRSVSGVSATQTLTAIDGRNFELDGSLPSVGDLIVIGVVDSIVFDCIVKSISPNDDFSATLTLVEKADQIYDAESTGDFPEYDPRLSETTSPDLSPPGPVASLVVADNGYECVSGLFSYYILLDWDPPEGAAPETYEVYVDDGTGYDLQDFTKESFYKYTVNQASLGTQHSFKVLAVSASGRKIQLGVASSVTATPIGNDTPPSNVVSLSIDSNGSSSQLFWDRLDQCDIVEYVFKYFSDYGSDLPITDLWEQGTPLARTASTSDSVAIQPRLGIYMIKAVRSNGIESEVAAFVRVSVTSLPDDLTDATTYLTNPSSLPALVNIEVIDDEFVLSQSVPSADPDVREYFLEGYIYPVDVLPGDSTILKKIDTDIIIAGVIPNADRTVFHVDFQYRTGSEIGVMGDWVTMDEVDPLNEYDLVDSSEWKSIVYGSVDSIITQYRIRVRTFDKSVTPRISQASLTVYKQRRTVQFYNLAYDPGDIYSAFYYDPEFDPGLPPPSVQITLLDGESGDYFELFSFPDFFSIAIYDSTGTPVVRNFNATATGIGRVT